MERPQKLILTFDDLPLQEAIKKLFDDPDFIRSEALLITDAGREWILQKVIGNLPKELTGHYRFEHILLSVNQFRKLNQDHIQKRLIILEHARNQMTPKCFYQGKVSTECSNEIDLEKPIIQSLEEKDSKSDLELLTMAMISLSSDPQLLTLGPESVTQAEHSVCLTLSA